MKTKRIFYWSVTILLAAMMLISGTSYLFKTAHVAKEFTALGFPLYIIVPLGIAKAIAALVLLNNQYKKLVEWAYAGLFFDFILALSAHLMIGDGEYALAIIAILLLSISYHYKDQVRT
ncbi:MAG: DoxX family protein [Flavobacteriaceae bacterium]